MCGIAGLYAYGAAAQPADRPELLAMRDHMQARGPDAAGEWWSADRRIALGHRRLAIIDLSERGAQPMTSADGNLVVICNGEIYNHRELRRGLERRGRRFRSDSDTEVLLHLYAEQGEAMVHALRGMFAFALWDVAHGRLLLARDPYGIKPLYYADDGCTLRFASQVKALLAGGQIARTPEPAGIVGFYLFGSVPEPFTLYEQIRAVPAGSLLRVDRSGRGEPAAYCSPAQVWAEAERDAAMVRADEDRQAVIRDALLDSVRHHMVADVPVGAFLSAGIDSGALLGLMSEVADTPPAGRDRFGCQAGDRSALQAVTLAFDEYRGTDDDEAPFAAEIAARYGARHSVRTVRRAELSADLPRILDAMDQPSIDGINTWFASKAAREAGLKVAVSGLGGDELFGGYPAFRDIPLWTRLLWLPARLPGLAALYEQVQETFAPLFAGLNPKVAGMLRYGGSFPGAYLLRRGLFLPSEVPLVLDPELAREGLRRLAPLALIGGVLEPARAAGPGKRDLLRDGTGRDTGAPRTAFGKVAALESSLYMRNQLLRDIDWSGMAHSLEVRLPLVDAWLVRAVAGCVVSRPVSNQKRLLAGAPRPALPTWASRRSKTGFTTPIATWQRQLQGGLPPQACSAVLGRSSPWARRWACAVASSF